MECIYEGKECLYDLSMTWVGMKQSSGKPLAMFIDKVENFNFKPYAFVPTGVHKV